MTSPGPVPLTASTRRVLEFDRVLDRIAGYAQTPMGGAGVRALEPRSDPGEVSRLHDAIEELRRYAAARGYAGLGLATPIDTALARVATRGVVLEADELLEVARLARVADQLRRHLPRDADAWPTLSADRESIADLRPLVQQVDAMFGPDGELRDDASPELQRIRRSARRLRSDVRQRLERLTRDERLRDALGDQVVTERAGRFVVPVRSGHRDWLTIPRRCDWRETPDCWK